jgi:putative addiction module component (TIGR02574 family)
MSPLSEELLKKALALPPVERAELLERLVLSFELPDRKRIDELWAVEAEDRIDAYDAGKMAAVPAKDVFDEINRQAE